MAAITYGVGSPATKSAGTKPVAPLWKRVWNAFVEARMNQAMREIALHRHLMPDEMEATFNRGSAKTNP